MPALIKPLPCPTAAEIKQTRQRLAMSQGFAAGLIGVTQGTWSLWEKGVNTMHRAFWFAWRIRAIEHRRACLRNDELEVPTDIDPEKLPEFYEEDGDEFATRDPGEE